MEDNKPFADGFFGVIASCRKKGSAPVADPFFFGRGEGDVVDGIALRAVLTSGQTGDDGFVRDLQ